jgi:hypothetical protein
VQQSICFPRQHSQGQAGSVVCEEVCSVSLYRNCHVVWRTHREILILFHLLAHKLEIDGSIGLLIKSCLLIAYIRTANYFGAISESLYKPITVTARSKAWTVFARSNAMIVGSNPTQGMEVCVVYIYSVCLVMCVGRGLETGWSPVQGVLPTVYRTKKLKKRPCPTKGCRAIIIIIIYHYKCWFF